VALGYSIPMSVFGGLAPLVAAWLIAITDNPLSPSCYLIFTARLSLFALSAIQSCSRRAVWVISVRCGHLQRKRSPMQSALAAVLCSSLQWLLR
jgi:hypothetical protein